MARSSGLTAEQQRLAVLLQQPENRNCVDCKAPAPKWASLNLGVFMCMDCSGIHRMLGTHITKIKSTTLDKWEPQWVDFMSRVGNIRFNAVYEATLVDRNKKLRPTSSMDDREKYIRAKYERQLFRGPPNRESLRRAAAEQDTTIEALGAGYMEGIDTSSPTTAGGAAPTDAAKTVNPAVLRRQQKKAAEEAEAKAKADAELYASRAAEEAMIQQEHMKTAALHSSIADVFSAPSAIVAPSFPVTGTAPTANVSASSFSFLSGASQPAPASTQPAASALSFLNGAAPVEAPTPVSGFSFVSPNTANDRASADLLSPVVPSSAPPAVTGSLFGGLSVSSPQPATGAVAPNPASSGFAFLASSQPAVASAQTVQRPQPQPQQAPTTVLSPPSFPPTQDFAGSPFTPTTTSTTAVPAAGTVNITIVMPDIHGASNVQASLASYAKVYENLPSNLDGVMSRQSVLSSVHAKALAELMKEFQAKQAVLNAAYQSALEKITGKLTSLSLEQTPTGSYSSGKSNAVSVGGSNKAALEEALTSLELGVATPSLDLRSGNSAPPKPAANTSSSSSTDMFAGMQAPTPAPAPTPAATFASAPASGDLFAGMSAPAPAFDLPFAAASNSFAPPPTVIAGSPAPASLFTGLSAAKTDAVVPPPSSQPAMGGFFAGLSTASPPVTVPDYSATLPPPVSTPPQTTPSLFDNMSVSAQQPAASTASSLSFMSQPRAATPPAVTAPVAHSTVPSFALRRQLTEYETQPSVSAPAVPQALYSADDDVSTGPPPAPEEADEDVATANARAAAALFQ